MIDVNANSQVATFASGGPSGLGGNMFEVIVGKNDNTVYVSSNDQNVYAFDPETGQVTTTLHLGGQLTDGFAFGEVAQHPDGVRLYADQIGDGNVAEINTETNTVTRTFHISPGSTRLQGMAVSGDGSLLYVADEGGVLRVRTFKTTLSDAREVQQVIDEASHQTRLPRYDIKGFSDIEACRSELADRGVTVGDIRHKNTDGGWRGGFLPGLDPERAEQIGQPFEGPAAVADRESLEAEPD